eukprot:118577-Amphidinium_carterae.3
MESVMGCLTEDATEVAQATVSHVARTYGQSSPCRGFQTEVVTQELIPTDTVTVWCVHAYVLHGLGQGLREVELALKRYYTQSGMSVVVVRMKQLSNAEGTPNPDGNVWFINDAVCVCAMVTGRCRCTLANDASGDGGACRQACTAAKGGGAFTPGWKPA